MKQCPNCGPVPDQTKPCGYCFSRLVTVISDEDDFAFDPSEIAGLTDEEVDRLISELFDGLEINI